MQQSRSANMTPPVVSIIIVNYNGAGFLKGCLDSLRNVSEPSFEVILVDNASTDNSLDVLKKYPNVQLVKSQENVGFAGGNNLGLEHARGAYVLLLNNDTIVHPEFLAPLVHYLDAHPEAWVVQGKMTLPNYQNSLDVCGSFLTAFGVPYHYGFYKPDQPKYSRNFPVFSGKGACLMLRRDIVSKVGGFLFDPEFFCYYEESDFCHRVWLAGGEVHFVGAKPIQHLMGSTAGGPHSLFTLRHYLRNMTFSLSSNLSALYALRILPLFFGVLFVSALAALARGKVSVCGAHFSAVFHLFRRLPEVARRRKLISIIRTRTDRQIAGKVLRTPRLSYFVKTATSGLSTFEDGPLN